jgi:hypothetical protein
MTPQEFGRLFTEGKNCSLNTALLLQEKQRFHVEKWPNSAKACNTLASNFANPCATGKIPGKACLPPAEGEGLLSIRFVSSCYSAGAEWQPACSTSIGRLTSRRDSFLKRL